MNEFLEFARRAPPRLEPVALRPLLEEVREVTAGAARITVDAERACWSAPTPDSSGAPS